MSVEPWEARFVQSERTRPRREPYTATGIRRVPCVRCGLPSGQQWQVCADGNQYRGICADCDVELNYVVLRFMFGPTEAKEKIGPYAERLGVDLRGVTGRLP